MLMLAVMFTLLVAGVVLVVISVEFDIEILFLVGQLLVATAAISFLLLALILTWTVALN